MPLIIWAVVADPPTISPVARFSFLRRYQNRSFLIHSSRVLRKNSRQLKTQQI